MPTTFIQKLTKDIATVRRRGVVVVMLVASALATLLTMRAEIAFDETSIRQGPAPERWPSHSSIGAVSEHPLIVVFAHPLCNCMQATAAMLDETLNLPEVRSLAPKVTWVLVPPGADRTLPGLWRERQSRGEQVLWDQGGGEAKRFGARTSGQVLLYDAGGILLFDGGITGSRGHVGSNYAADSFREALLSGRRVSSGHRAFGCALFSFDEPGPAEARS